MDEAKVQKLQLIHRELARYLREQHEVINNQTLVIAAIRKTVEVDSVLGARYKENLQSLKADATIQPNPMQAGVLGKLLDDLANW